MDTNENTRPAPRSRVPAPVDGPAVNTDPRPPTPAGTAANVVRGGLIGLAETIPGVSGGTVALVTGIYERLIASAKNITELPKDAVTKGDEAVVSEVEAGEDHIKAKYEKALQDTDVDPQTRAAIEKAWTSVKSGHDQMRDIKHMLKH